MTFPEFGNKSRPMRERDQQPEPSMVQDGIMFVLRKTLDPERFNKVVRPMLYAVCRNDPENVHELVLQTMHASRRFSSMVAPFFAPPKNLTIKINGADVVPFGTSAGMDKNGEALDMFSRMFGFQESGTVVLRPREGNQKPRIATDEKSMDLYNAQGFPSKGIDYFLKNIAEYRENGGKGIVYVSVCGLPSSEKNAVDVAMSEMEEITARLNHFVDGLVWNPFSPNTAALKLLREPEIFYRTSKIMAQWAPNKLRLVKMGPYEPAEKGSNIRLLGRFLDGGGHGMVGPNTKMTPKDQLPEWIRKGWGYGSAGRSGTFLKEYRIRSVSDARMAFPDAVIIGTGGIFTEDAYPTFIAGANMIAGYTPYAYYGPGLVKPMMGAVSRELMRNGFEDMEELQANIRHIARKGS